MFYSLSSIHCSHITYLTHLYTAYQSSQFLCQHVTLLLKFTCKDFRSIFFSHEARPMWLQHLIQHELQQTISKPFTRLIGPRHVTTSREVSRQSLVERYSPRITVFKSNIYLDSLFLLFDCL